MRSRDAPTLGARYWTAISLASVFGANWGDFGSHDLHLGHLLGLARWFTEWPTPTQVVARRGSTPLRLAAGLGTSCGHALLHPV
jgi:hypothetical protein